MKKKKIYEALSMISSLFIILIIFLFKKCICMYSSVRMCVQMSAQMFTCGKASGGQWQSSSIAPWLTPMRQALSPNPELTFSWLGR